MDGAHKATDRILAAAEKDIAALFNKTNKNIQNQTDRLIDELFTGSNGRKDEIIKIFVNNIVSANEKTVEIINGTHAEIYALNVKGAADNIIRQLKGGG